MRPEARARPLHELWARTTLTAYQKARRQSSALRGCHRPPAPARSDQRPTDTPEHEASPDDGLRVHRAIRRSLPYHRVPPRETRAPELDGPVATPDAKYRLPPHGPRRPVGQTFPHKL